MFHLGRNTGCCDVHSVVLGIYVMTNKLRLCTGCKIRFPMEEMFKTPAGWFHAFECASNLALTRQKRSTEKAERKDIRERKAALLTVSDWKKRVQTVFNKYIRLRDKWEPCISCGKSVIEIEKKQGWKTGGAWDCGHYLSVGAYPELRFELYNAHKQCKSCNGGSGNYARKNHTVAKEYRIRIIEKIGIGKVEWLEGPHQPAKYTIDQLKELRQHFNKLIKEL